MIELEQLPSALKEAFSLFRLLNDLEYEIDDISVAYDDGCLFVVLETEDTYFALDVGGLDCTFDEFLDVWEKWTIIFLTGSVDEKTFDVIWEKSLVRSQKDSIINAINIRKKIQ